MSDDGLTLFAPASGFGRAAVSVMRISGPASGPLIEALGRSRPPARRLALRALRDPADGTLLDRALVVFMPGPDTFTGEDMAELHLHGGLAVRQAVFRALAAFPGCRPALPGEFARRAVLNGRIGLTEAEGIADLVDAETEAQRRQALRQLDGALARQVDLWRDEALDCLAGAEAALDFSDEGDVDDQGLDRALQARTQALHQAVTAVLADERAGERLRDGFVVVLAGPPNAGKSTLLNTLSRRDAAIVSPIPGTTRDSIEVRCDLRGLPVVLIDTAGLRESDDAIEAEGITRTRRQMRQADLVLCLIPADDPADPPDGLPAGSLVIRTKGDLDAPSDDGGSGGASSAELTISAVSGAGIAALLGLVHERARSAFGAGDALVTRERHREALERCAAHLARVAQADQRTPPELICEDLRLAVRALGEIGGHVGVDDVLDRLFSGFCIGK